MKRLLLTALLLSACAGSSPLLTDAQLVDSALAGLVPLLPAADQVTAQGVLTTINTNITTFKQNGESAAVFAGVIQTDIQNLTPMLLADFKANATITGVVTSLTALASELLSQDMSTTPTTAPPAPAPAKTMVATQADPRPTLRAFVASNQTFMQRWFGL